MVDFVQLPDDSANTGKKVANRVLVDGPDDFYVQRVDVDSLPALPAGTNNIGDVDVASLPALPAGTNNIGDVDVVSLPALPAGTALIGKVGIDQTTPGTTNRVDIGAALPAGNNNIGDVDVASLPALPAGTALIGKVGIDQTTPGTTNRVDIGAAIPAGNNNIGDVDVASQPARARTADSIAAGIQTDSIMNGLTALTPKFAKIDATASADLIALVSSKKLRVLSLMVTATTAGTAKFQSGATTDLTGAMPVDDKGGLVLPFNPTGWFETAAGEKLNVVLASITAFKGCLSYIEV